MKKFDYTVTIIYSDGTCHTLFAKTAREAKSIKSIARSGVRDISDITIHKQSASKRKEVIV